ncbi:hypothetical protein ACA910_001789 [Epithemia clementina (nom. ined.)]
MNHYQSTAPEGESSPLLSPSSPPPPPPPPPPPCSKRTLPVQSGTTIWVKLVFLQSVLCTFLLAGVYLRLMNLEQQQQQQQQQQPSPPPPQENLHFDSAPGRWAALSLASKTASMAPPIQYNLRSSGARAEIERDHNSIIDRDKVAAAQSSTSMQRATTRTSSSSFSARTTKAAVTTTITNVLIVYDDSSPEMILMAETVAQGVQQVANATARLRTLAQVNYTQDLVHWSDALILGSSVINANIHPQMSHWISTWKFDNTPSNKTQTFDQEQDNGDVLPSSPSLWSDGKVGAAFAVGGGISAGQELVLLQLLEALLIFQFLVVGGPDWKSAFGASAVMGEGPFRTTTSIIMDHDPAATTNNNQQQLVSPLFLEKALGLGHRVATIAQRLCYYHSSAVF